MSKFLALLVLASSMTAFARPSCLIDKTCMEYNGEIIDLRSKAQQSLDSLECNPLLENCLEISADKAVPEISSKDFKKLIGSQGTERFIPIEKSDLITLAGALSLGTVIFANDREIMDFVQENKAEISEPIANFGNIFGREAILPVAAGSYFMGAVLKNGKLKKLGIFTVAGTLAGQIVAEMFKKNFQRMRPNASESPYDFFVDGNNSFISGHAAGAFSMATAIAEVYKDQPVIPYLAYGAAALTAYARMHDNKHWASDVLAGAVAGHLVTKILIRTLENSERSGKSGLVVTPDVGVEMDGSVRTGFRIKYTGAYQPAPLMCKKSGLKGSDLVSLCIEEAFARSEQN